MKKWKAAAYLRLSRDDGQYGESMSITNQKSIIRDWVVDKSDIDLVDFYIDDGFTGTNFNRPAFNELMFDLKIDRINCVIVKDLSRLGRNSSKVSQLIDEYFPKNKVRFIAINDNLDTLGLIDDNDVTGFKLVCNEFYVKDISKKVKSALRASAKKGNFIGSSAPFGYKKSKEDYHKLVIDEGSAGTVRKIFEDYAKGKSGREIANDLNSNKILSPYNYKRQQAGLELDDTKYWTSATVLQILHNEVYFGNLVQHKRENLSYKLNQRRVTDEEERIVCKDTHAAIIDCKLQETIKERFNKNYSTNSRKRNNGSQVPVLFSGLLKCFDCGSKMPATIKNEKRCYRCYRYNTSGRSACTSHFIYEEELEKFVLQDIKKLIYNYKIDQENFINNLLNTLNNNKTNISENMKLKRISISKEIETIKCDMIELYNDKKNNVLSSNMFSILSKQYDEQLQELLKELDSCDKIINELNVNENCVYGWIKNLLTIEKLEHPTFEYYHSIIDHILIKNVGEENRILIKYKVGFIADIRIVRKLKIA